MLKYTTSLILIFASLCEKMQTLSKSYGVQAMDLEIDSKGRCSIDGVKYPAVGFGTYPLEGNSCLKAVHEAAELGYRIIDTATFYNNFFPIGEALKPLERENFYLISKVWPDAHPSALLLKDIQITLKELQTYYLDAYLLHWPNSKVSLEDTLYTMDHLRKQNIIRHIGLSNVTVNHLKRALELNVPLSWVQVEMHPLFYDAELLDFCHHHQIGVQAWAPLARGRINRDSFLNQLSQKYEKKVPQIAIKWILQHDCIPLPASQNQQHMQENLDVTDFVLTDQEMQQIDERAKKGKRERIKKQMGLGFTDEFDFSYDECWPIRT